MAGADVRSSLVARDRFARTGAADRSGGLDRVADDHDGGTGSRASCASSRPETAASRGAATAATARPVRSARRGTGRFALLLAGVGSSPGSAGVCGLTQRAAGSTAPSMSAARGSSVTLAFRSLDSLSTGDAAADSSIVTSTGRSKSESDAAVARTASGAAAHQSPARTSGKRGTTPSVHAAGRGRSHSSRAKRCVCELGTLGAVDHRKILCGKPVGRWCSGRWK